MIEPTRIVALHPNGQDIRFPCCSPRFHALELFDDRSQTFGSLHPAVRYGVLPTEQEPQVVSRGDGFDLLAQPVEGVAVNPREQTALAPFDLRRLRREGAAQDEAFSFERAESGVDQARVQTEQLRELLGRGRT